MVDHYFTEKKAEDDENIKRQKICKENESLLREIKKLADRFVFQIWKKNHVKQFACIEPFSWPYVVRCACERPYVRQQLQHLLLSHSIRFDNKNCSNDFPMAKTGQPFSHVSCKYICKENFQSFFFQIFPFLGLYGGPATGVIFFLK